jgi:hypothetical protein
MKIKERLSLKFLFKGLAVLFRPFNCSVHTSIVKTPTMKDIPKRRITVTSSLNEISRDQLEIKVGLKGEY